ncbi:hypothetical protein CALCODRAFT_349934 [Calocera cornea HHB12733]|uniref:Uncharacterized protein n=1 Tax=Calocera cornea HHB12733 TaxID=1353952 RepID=A0A165JF30_9BASI|nr:hypothetical protein CALCODRAFT_349934 [Calocera cornea HHB12733]
MTSAMRAYNADGADRPPCLPPITSTLIPCIVGVHDSIQHTWQAQTPTPRRRESPTRSPQIPTSTPTSAQSPATQSCPPSTSSSQSAHGPTALLRPICPC